MISKAKSSEQNNDKMNNSDDVILCQLSLMVDTENVCIFLVFSWYSESI